MRKLLLTFSISVCNVLLFGQWVTRGPELGLGILEDLIIKGDTVYMLSDVLPRVSTDRGYTWKTLDVGQDFNDWQSTISSMAIDSKGNTYFAYYKSGSVRVVKTTDAGNTYAVILSISGSHTTRLLCTSRDTLIVFYDYSYGAYASYISNDYGQSWAVYSALVDENVYYVPRLAFNNDTVFAFSKNEIYYSANSGKSFSKYGNSLPYGNIYCLRFDKDNNIYAGVTYTDENNNIDSYVFKSTDHGNNWEILYVIDRVEGSWCGYVNEIIFDQQDNIYVGTNKGLFYSKDNGKTWKYAGGERQIAYSNDDNRIWSFYNSRFAYFDENATSIRNTTVSKNLIYPNPAKNYLYFTQKVDDKTIFVYDVTGKPHKLKVQNNCINIQHLAPGVYYITLQEQKIRFIIL